jgi:hypothetical protein
MAIELELVPLCTVEVTLGAQVFVGDGPAGTRVVAEVEAAEVRGERLSGKARPSAIADWLVVNGTIGTLDVRATIETDDGATVYLTYGGRIDLSNGPDGATVYIAPRFETGDERYAWLNLVQAVGKGRLDGSNLSYVIHEVR